MKRNLGLLALVSAFSIVSFSAQATPVFANKEKKACNYCHSVDQGGGPRGFRGLYYKGHNLSFAGYKEAAEAKKAGVKSGALGSKSKPTKPYTGK
jgi:hypothetical protein